MPRKPMADKGAQTSLRLPGDLHRQLSDAAGDRGIGEEIRQRLAASFGPAPAAASSDDPWFAELLTALGHAAIAAAKLRPSPPERMLTAEDNKSREWFQRHHPDAQDTTAYKCFVEAAALLFQAFAPEGYPTVTIETGLRLSYQITTLALGQSGPRGVEAFTNLPPLDQDLMERFGGTSARRLAAEAEQGDER